MNRPLANPEISQSRTAKNRPRSWPNHRRS